MPLTCQCTRQYSHWTAGLTSRWHASTNFELGRQQAAPSRPHFWLTHLFCGIRLLFYPESWAREQMQSWSGGSGRWSLTAKFKAREVSPSSVRCRSSRHRSSPLAPTQRTAAGSKWTHESRIFGQSLKHRSSQWRHGSFRKHFHTGSSVSFPFPFWSWGRRTRISGPRNSPAFLARFHLSSLWLLAHRSFADATCGQFSASWLTFYSSVIFDI